MAKQKRMASTGVVLTSALASLLAMLLPSCCLTRTKSAEKAKTDSLSQQDSLAQPIDEHADMPVLMYGVPYQQYEVKKNVPTPVQEKEKKGESKTNDSPATPRAKL